MSYVGSARAATCTGAVAIMLFSVTPAYGADSGDPDARLCEDAAALAARESGVPRDVLMAITLTETGRSSPEGATRPWPWAVNAAGESHWFPTRGEAEQFAEAAVLAGRTNFDVGCFQLNHRWHAGGFASTHEMFDPQTNASYAARYLKGLHARSGDWSIAAGDYHSATPEFARRYRGRFDRFYAGVPDSAPAPARDNSYPLLLAGGIRTGGSLVPLDQTPRPLFGD